MEMEQTSTNELLLKDLSYPLYKSKGWIRLLGILAIIYGGFVALSIVGIIVAWLPIWLGVLLNQVASRIENAYLTGDKEAFVSAQKSLATYFTIYGIVAVVSIAIGILAMVVLFSTGWIYDLQEFGNQSYY